LAADTGSPRRERLAPIERCTCEVALTRHPGVLTECRLRLDDAFDIAGVEECGSGSLDDAHVRLAEVEERSAEAEQQTPRSSTAARKNRAAAS
jgi:hypothetical protein